MRADSEYKRRMSDADFRMNEHLARALARQDVDEPLQQPAPRTEETRGGDAAEPQAKKSRQEPGYQPTWSDASAASSSSSAWVEPPRRSEPVSDKAPEVESQQRGERAFWDDDEPLPAKKRRCDLEAEMLSSGVGGQYGV